MHRCGLDVFEDEPNMVPGLSDCENVVVVPHIASASLWTRSGMVSTFYLTPLYQHFMSFPQPENSESGTRAERCCTSPWRLHHPLVA